MRLTLYSTYALRLLTYLTAFEGRACSIAEIADRYGVSRDHLAKVGHALGKAGLIQAHRGRSGGYRLALPPQEISIGQAVRLTERRFGISRREMDRFEVKIDAMRQDALAAFMAVLDGYNLSDLTAGKETAAAWTR